LAFVATKPAVEARVAASAEQTADSRLLIVRRPWRIGRALLRGS
jgi:hypothetical protein